MSNTPNFKLSWKYILGEIVLIFIGISLAMGFQNWNQDRLLRIESKDAQEVIKSDLEQVITEMERMVENEDNHNQILFQFGSVQGLDSISKLSHFDSLTFDALYSYGNINPSFPAYEALLKSGKIEIIKNKEFRNLLSELDSQFKRLINAVSERQTAQIVHVDPVLLKHSNVPRLRNSYLIRGAAQADLIPQDVNHIEMLKNPITQNAMAYKLSLGSGVRGEIEAFINVCLKIKSL